MNPCLRNVPAALLLAAICCAQGRPEFDVASLKPASGSNPDGTININLGTARNGQVTLGNACLNDCLRFAYDITSDEQIAGPEWTRDKSVRFDVLAKAAPDTPREVLLVMLQNLLTDRFQMKLHREPRTIAHYVLTQAKGGSKLMEATAPPSPNTHFRGNIHNTRMSLTLLGTILARFELRLPVINETGLNGFYVVDLKWSPEPLPGTAPNPEPSPYPSLYKAIQDQLGLKLESRKSPVDVLVIESVLKVPIGN